MIIADERQLRAEIAERKRRIVSLQTNITANSAQLEALQAQLSELVAAKKPLPKPVAADPEAAPKVKKKKKKPVPPEEPEQPPE